MQESIHIQLIDKTAQAILAGDENRFKYISIELQQHEKAINNLIVNYYFMDRKRVYNVLINTDSIQIDRHGRGSFTVGYMLGLFNACDANNNVQSHMKILMKADFDTQIMVLTGEDIPERKPDGL